MHEAVIENMDTAFIEDVNEDSGFNFRLAKHAQLMGRLAKMSLYELIFSRICMFLLPICCQDFRFLTEMSCRPSKIEKAVEKLDQS